MCLALECKMEFLDIQIAEVLSQMQGMLLSFLVDNLLVDSSSIGYEYYIPMLQYT